jgi:flagellar biogenesis protein FliO
LSATIHRFPLHAVRHVPNAAQHPSRPPQVASFPTAPPQGAIFHLGLFAFVIALVLLGVWLLDGVTSVGRGDNDCPLAYVRTCGSGQGS